jgi:hypothetical protein
MRKFYDEFVLAGVEPQLKQTAESQLWKKVIGTSGEFGDDRAFKAVCFKGPVTLGLNSGLISAG